MKAYIFKKPFQNFFFSRIKKADLKAVTPERFKNIYNFFFSGKRKKRGFFYPEEEINFLKEIEKNRDRPPGGFLL